MPDVSELILTDQKIIYFVTDPNLKIIEAKGTEDLLKLSAVQPVLGASLIGIAPELIGLEDVLIDILAGQLERFELSWVNRETPGKLVRYLNMVTLPHQSGTGNVDGLVHIWHDVTDMGQLNQELAQHRNELKLTQKQLTNANAELQTINAELQHLSNLKSMFVSFAAHELGSPLTSIMGYVGLMLDDIYGPLNESQRQCLHIVERSVGRLKTITRNLLVATNIETGRIEAFLNRTDLLRLVTDVLAEHEPQISAKSQQLTIHAPQQQLPDAWCDTNLASQIIDNLVSNASKYTPNGGQITVSVSVSNEEGFLQVTVEDNGVGISPDEQDQLFKKFTRLSSANETSVSGTGLGLYITRSLIDLHGGRVWFESEAKKGSKFNVTFPIAEDDR